MGRLLVVPSVLFSRVHISAVPIKEKNGQNLWPWLFRGRDCLSHLTANYHLFKLFSSFLWSSLALNKHTDPLDRSKVMALQCFQVWAAFVCRERAERCQSGRMQSLARAMSGFICITSTCAQSWTFFVRSDVFYWYFSTFRSKCCGHHSEQQ